MNMHDALSSKNLVNKKIIYSDMNFYKKYKGKDLKVTCVFDVNENSLDKCLEIVLNSNSYVLFEAVQYSYIQKKVWFYTYDTISLDEYNKSREFKYKDISSDIEMLEEVKNVLVCDKNNDDRCISLYDVLNYYKDKNRLFDNIPKNAGPRLEYSFSNTTNASSFIIYGFDYSKNELKICFNYRNSYRKIVLTKRNGDIFIVRSEAANGKEVFVSICNELSLIYDEYEYYKGFKEQYNFGIRSVNSNFLVDVSSNQINVYIKNNSKYGRKLFCLESYCYDKCDNNQYNYEYGSYDSIMLLRNHEEEFLKKIFIKISDCPMWCRGELREMRMKQLKEERLNDEKKMKYQKKLSLIRKIFPFIKK